MVQPTLGWYIRHDEKVRERRRKNGVWVPPACPCASGTPGECWKP